jgi:hypothetical protein
MGSSGIKKDALAQYGTNSGTAAGALSTINPIYSNLASGTVGYSPTQMANQLTANSQSTGGSVAGAVGQGGLLAARTGNAGGATAALDDAARGGAQTESANALGVQNASDALAHQNQQIGLSGLNSIYQGANGQANANLNAASNAPQPFGQKLLGTAVGDLSLSKKI